MNAKEMIFILLLVVMSPAILLAIIARFILSGFHVGWNLAEEAISWILD